MSTLNVNTINAATSGQAVSVDVQNPRSFRNLIINGAFQVAQRGTSSTTNGFGSLDRWKHLYGGENEDPTFAQHALTSSDTGPWEKGFRNSFHITNGNQTGGADAGDYLQCQTVLEAQDIANSGWDYTSASSYITISFWVKSSVAQSFPFSVQTSDGTAYRYTFETGSLSANTWTKVTKTIPGNANLTFNNDNGTGLYVFFWPFLGTTWTGSITEETWFATSGNSYCDNMTSTWWTTNDATFEVTGIQLEVGSYATDFEHRSYGDEVARCQRYFHKFAGGSDAYMFAGKGQGSASADIGVPLNTPLRVQPALTCSASRYFSSHDGGFSSSTTAPTVIQYDASLNSPMLAINCGGHDASNNAAGTWCPHATTFSIDAEL